MKIRPRNWKSFQHYGDRRPTWIKLHRALLDDFEFHCLQVASRALAPMLWLLASESEDGSIDADPKKLAFRLRTTEKEINSAIRPLIDGKFFEVVHVDSVALADGEQFGVSEKRREEKIAASAASTLKTSSEADDPPPPGLDLSAWDRWTKYRHGIRKPLREVSIPAAQREMAALGEDQAAAVEHTIAKGWTGLRAPDKPKLKPEGTNGIQVFRAGGA